MIRGKKLNMEKTATIDIFRTWARTSEGMHGFSVCDVGLCLCRLCLFALVPGSRVQMAIPQWRSPQFHSVPFSRNTVRKKRATEGRLNFFQLLFTLGVPLQCLAIRLRRGLFGHGCRDGFLQKLFCLTITGKILLDISSGQFDEFLFFYRCRSFFFAFYKDSIFILILYISFSLEDIFPMQKSSKPKVLEVLAFATASASPLIKQQRLSGK